MSVIGTNYYKRVKLGLIKSVYKVPKPWREEVISLLEADGYIINEEDGAISLQSK